MTVDGLLGLRVHVDALAQALDEVEYAPAAANGLQAPSLWKRRLTEREQELLLYITAGWSDRQIAEAVSIGEKTIRCHVSNMLNKLGAGNRTTLALWALATGQVEITEAVNLMLIHHPHMGA